MGFLSVAELREIGFRALGENVLISERASIYGAERITIGSNVRIDDYCVISAGIGGIEIGRNIHIGAFASIAGESKVTLMDFSGLSGRVSIYSSSDDYSGSTLTNPTVPVAFKDVTSSPVLIGRHTIVGSGSVILPGTTLADGCAVGALSVVRGEWESFTILAGAPAKKRGNRSRNLLMLEQGYLQSLSGDSA